MNESYEILTTADAQAWRAALPADMCVMGSLEYARIKERIMGQSARLFLTGPPGARVAYPLFLRPLPFQTAQASGARWDTATPEYTGPIRVDPPGDEEAFPAAGFQEAFGRFCRDEGIVAEFAHLNPWHAGKELLAPARVEVNREIVYVDLTWGEEEIWKRSLSSDTRRQTRQSSDFGVRVRQAESPKDVMDFYNLHHLTMDRLEAGGSYYLGPDYFLGIFETMPANAFFLLAEFEGRTVAGGLYFQDATDVYWHLSAVDMEFSRVRPVNAYHFEAIKRAARAGRRRMLCGGAFRQGDGVFRFKAGFSPLRVPFQVCKQVHDPEAYAGLVQAWIRHYGGIQPDPELFPAYRCTPPAAEGLSLAVKAF
ncbi:MAG: peptidoglycan bridge formation glycyltransferase FemA/FemB family protein [Holophaga sp.]|jgi:hypothetical protein